MNKRFLEALQQLGLDIAKEFGIKLIEQGHEATGALINSFEIDAKVSSNGFELVVSGNKYWVYVDQGARFSSKQPPIEALVKWVEAKGISAPDKTTRQLAFAIAATIKKRGLQREKTLEGFVEKSLKKFDDLLDAIFAEVAEKEIDVQLDKWVKELEKPNTIPVV